MTTYDGWSALVGQYYDMNDFGIFLRCSKGYLFYVVLLP